MLSAIKYGHDKLTLSDFISALRTKDLELRKENKNNDVNLYVRGRIEKRDSNWCKDNSKSTGRSKSKEPKAKDKSKVNCFYFGKEYEKKIF